MLLPALLFALGPFLAAPKAVPLTPEVAAKLQAIAFQAARDGDTTTLKEYFAAGQPVNGTNGRGDTLLTVAAYAGEADAVAIILKQPKCRSTRKTRWG